MQCGDSDAHLSNFVRGNELTLCHCVTWSELVVGMCLLMSKLPSNHTGEICASFRIWLQVCAVEFVLLPIIPFMNIIWLYTSEPNHKPCGLIARKIPMIIP